MAGCCSGDLPLQGLGFVTKQTSAACPPFRLAAGCAEGRGEKGKGKAGQGEEGQLAVAGVGHLVTVAGRDHHGLPARAWVEAAWWLCCLLLMKPFWMAVLSCDASGAGEADASETRYFFTKGKVFRSAISL